MPAFLGGMLYPQSGHQIIPMDEDEAPLSGPRNRISSKAPTVQMEAPRSAPASQVRQVQVERVAPLRQASANDVEERDVLINAGNPRATRYCFVSPRRGGR